MSEPPHESIPVEDILGEGTDTRMQSPLYLIPFNLTTLSLSGIQVAIPMSLSQRKINLPRDNPAFLMDQGTFSTCTTRWQRKKTIKWQIAGKRMQMASLFS
jgi:hypothetical protein